ncbi:MAG: alpha/beta hydrolase [Steroidobacteraceae bacterium]
MNPRLRRILILLLLAAAVGWSLSQHRGGRGDSSLAVSAVAPDVMHMGSLTLEPCDIGRRGNGAPTMRAYCSAFDVPENHAAPDGRHIRLHVALVRAESAQAEPDLVTFLDGGPGGAATDDYPSIAGAFEPLRRQRAVLLVDQRGTGGSNALDCGDDNTGDDNGGDAATNGTALASSADAVRACVTRLAPRAAPQFYSTSDAVEDLELVRRALGSPRLDLIGVSYGTRMAQQYAKRYPQGVRAIVLDSSVPNSLVLGSEHARNLEDVLRSLFKRCTADRSCSTRYGDPNQTLRRLLVKLRAHPQQLTLRDPFTFRVEQKTIGPGALVQLARLYAYSPYTAALLPYVLQEADNGHYEPLLGQAQVVVGDVSDSLTGGMGLSVICAEDADRLKANPADADTVMGNALTDWLLKTCPLWPHGSHPADFSEPLRTDVPVLLLAGELDPVTPPRYAAQIARTLPRSRVLNVTGQGHGLVSVGCMPRILDDFLRKLDVRALDASCLGQLGSTPFFIDANGSNP